jgi:hypothetical protein
MEEEETCGKNGRMSSPTFQYQPSGRRDLGRPKQRWKDQWHSEGQEEQDLIIMMMMMIMMNFLVTF